MARFLVLVQFTDQGRRAVEKSPERAARFRAMCEARGAQVEALYWALGAYDGAIVLRAADVEMVTALTLALVREGNVTTQTLPLFDQDEFSQIVAALPAG